MWHRYISATRIEDVISVLAQEREKVRVVAGATDILLEMERGAKKGVEVLVDISRIPSLDRITLDQNGMIHLGPMVTHNHCVGSKLIREMAYPLARACWEVGSPQIRNRGTVAGNLITASPANDTISPLMALGAMVVLRSERGERIVSLRDFYLGVRRTVMEADEMLVDIFFPALKPSQRGTYIKFALRRAQAISLVNTAVILTFDGDIISDAVVTLGAVAPTIIHSRSAENYLSGKTLNAETIEMTAALAKGDARPINDIRGSAVFRRQIVRVIVKRALQAIHDKTEKENYPNEPILLWGGDTHSPSLLDTALTHEDNVPIATTINGKKYSFEHGHEKTLLRLLREDAQLVGTKEGCAEGECGACTVFLDGIAVMSCMVPAPRAHGAEIITVEGLADGEKLHPVQEAFIEDGAVQCGYCTPGFLMSAAKLLEERKSPTRNEIEQAITGNLCRCTGYYKIIQAIEHAAEKGK